MLHRLLTEQASFQRERRLVYRVAQAHLPWPWTLDTFPFAKQPGVDRSQIRALAGLEFVRRAQNLVLMGPTGTGKSGIAIGLLRQACLNGYTGRFYNAQALFDELYASLADRSTTKLLKAKMVDALGPVRPVFDRFYKTGDKRRNELDRLLRWCINQLEDPHQLRNRKRPARGLPKDIKELQT